jgi:hypothetical protein
VGPGKMIPKPQVSFIRREIQFHAILVDADSFIYV